MRLAPIHVLLLATATVGGASLHSELASPPEPPRVESLRLYINHEFGFSAEIPFYAPLCDPAVESQETGFVFFLDGGSNDCGTGIEADRHWVSFHEHYNAADYESAQDYAARMCGNGIRSPTDPATYGDLARWLPEMCRETRSDGLELTALYGLSPEGGTTYSAYLQTSPEEAGADRAVFLATLRTLKRFTPDPDDVRGTGWAAIHSRVLKEEREKEEREKEGTE